MCTFKRTNQPLSYLPLLSADHHPHSTLSLSLSGFLSVSHHTDMMMVTAINDLHGWEPGSMVKGERLMRCKLASTHRLFDLYGWAQISHTCLTVSVTFFSHHNSNIMLFFLNTYLLNTLFFLYMIWSERCNSEHMKSRYRIKCSTSMLRKILFCFTNGNISEWISHSSIMFCSVTIFGLYLCCFPPWQLRVSKEQEHFLVLPDGLAYSEVTGSSLVSDHRQD